jgi:hypothetical protein
VLAVVANQGQGPYSRERELLELSQVTLQGARNSGIPLQEASSTSKPEEQRDLKHAASKASTMKFIQNNLHHSKAAMTVLCQKLALGKAHIALIKEPRVHGSKISSLSCTAGTLFFHCPDDGGSKHL